MTRDYIRNAQIFQEISGVRHSKGDTAMGSGYWSADVYETAERLRKGKSAFTYSDSGARSVHPDLDPFDIGKRESRDSAEHPNSLAIAVLFDVTGSMGAV